MSPGGHPKTRGQNPQTRAMCPAQLLTIHGSDPAQGKDRAAQGIVFLCIIDGDRVQLCHSQAGRG